MKLSLDKKSELQEQNGNLLYQDMKKMQFCLSYAYGSLSPLKPSTANAKNYGSLAILPCA